ncbi:aminoacyl tRNA synthase complex-interacting multifunctional protein 1-like [Sycon ciliatum]|uniref:aminoacyl tRNA synthase complex-interacting multifunctional protein 1-like n=1 Tax=Sycon ciliatum TaxID=27933 RepID=UPI0020AC8594|eukprot:scpid73055/ scgid23456/ Aminoacyl tRNA synthase complex-interacting multifunctional protein 1; Multisynthase complex auxiliary component p43; Endothelial monocyte-activating polypeptide 2; EMAP-II; Small inducible cytokine subfamily E member 1
MFASMSVLLCRRQFPALARLAVANRTLCSNVESTPVPPEETDAAAPESSTPAIRMADFSRLDVRVGRVTTCAEHPGNENWYISGLDVGEEHDRPIVSGLAKYVSSEELTGRLVMVFCNLKKSNFRDMPSTAMIFACMKDEEVEILSVPEGSKPGDRIFVKEFDDLGPPDKVVNPKKTLWAGIKADLKVSNHLALYRNYPIVTSRGKITTVRLQDGLIG